MRPYLVPGACILAALSYLSSADWSSNLPHDSEEDFDQLSKNLIANGGCRFYYQRYSTHNPVRDEGGKELCRTKCGDDLNLNKTNCLYNILDDPGSSVWRWDPDGNLWGLGQCQCEHNTDWVLRGLDDSST